MRNHADAWARLLNVAVGPGDRSGAEVLTHALHGRKASLQRRDLALHVEVLGVEDRLSVLACTVNSPYQSVILRCEAGEFSHDLRRTHVRKGLKIADR